jgi:hypothetical protein
MLEMVAMTLERVPELVVLTLARVATMLANKGRSGRWQGRY